MLSSLSQHLPFHYTSLSPCVVKPDVEHSPSLPPILLSWRRQQFPPLMQLRSPMVMLQSRSVTPLPYSLEPVGAEKQLGCSAGKCAMEGREREDRGENKSKTGVKEMYKERRNQKLVIRKDYCNWLLGVKHCKGRTAQEPLRSCTVQLFTTTLMSLIPHYSFFPFLCCLSGGPTFCCWLKVCSGRSDHLLLCVLGKWIPLGTSQHLSAHCHFVSDE